MADTDLAISAGGSTCWELAFMGVPGVTIIRAENQRRIAETLDDAGILRTLGEAAAVDEEMIAGVVTALLGSPDHRAEMSARGEALTDGRGAERVAGELRTLIGNR